MNRFLVAGFPVWALLMLSAVFAQDGPIAPGFNVETFTASLIEKNIVAGLLVYSVFWFTRVYFPAADRQRSESVRIQTELKDAISEHTRVINQMVVEHTQAIRAMTERISLCPLRDDCRKVGESQP